MSDRPPELFADTHTYNVAVGRPQAAMKALIALNENEILSRSTDDLVDEHLASYDLRFPIIREDEAWIEDREVTYQLPGRVHTRFVEYDHIHTGRAHEIRFHVPFDGDPMLFKVQPSRRRIPGPRGQLLKEEVMITVTSDNKTREQVMAEFEGIIDSIKSASCNCQK